MKHKARFPRESEMNDFTALLRDVLTEAFAQHDGHEFKEVELDEWRCLTCNKTIVCLSGRS